MTQASLCRKTVSKGRRDDTLRPAGILFLFFRIFPDGGYIISVDELFASLVVRDLDPAVFDGEDRPDTAGRNVSYDFAALADHLFNKFIIQILIKTAEYITIFILKLSLIHI